MSTPPKTPTTPQSPDNGTGPSTAKSSVGPKIWFAALYPLVAGAALMFVAGFFALATLSEGEAMFAVFFVPAALLVIAGVHLWIKRSVEGRDDPRPWQFPTVLSTAMVAGIFVTGFTFALGTGVILPLPLVCSGLCLIGALVFALGTIRNRLVLALGAILGAVLLLMGMAGLLAAWQRHEREEELSQEVAAFGHPIAVLDDAGWEPTEMFVDQEASRVSVTYELAEPSRETDGFQIRVETVSMHDLNDRSVYAQCESDPGENGCEEHGDIVIADKSGSPEEAATEFTDGYVAELSTDLPTDEYGAAQAGSPDVDMVELAGQIRASEPGETEEIVDDVRV